VGYQSVRSFVEGNEKFPVLGSVEVFRGMRRGTVELVEGTYMGMAGTPARSYKQLGSTNKMIEAEPLLNVAADVAACAAIGFGSGRSIESAWGATAGLYGAQIVTDHSPLDPRRQEKSQEREVVRAQRDYIGDRAKVNVKLNDTGNLLKKYGSK